MVLNELLLKWRYINLQWRLWYVVCSIGSGVLWVPVCFKICTLYSLGLSRWIVAALALVKRSYLSLKKSSLLCDDLSGTTVRCNKGTVYELNLVTHGDDVTSCYINVQVHLLTILCWCAHKSCNCYFGNIVLFYLRR